ncbi:hypothetical protein [Uliginosibacterium sp. H1]|uniref:hypothetical protein n=1 Tax=Uliginosibacterium sp. H1 TaxID=3114757 RepID=UPI002E1867DA|nr:hypothetical protein [Uliginosibacterium sp. H1]
MTTMTACGMGDPSAGGDKAASAATTAAAVQRNDALTARARIASSDVPTDAVDGPLLAGCQMFPGDAVFNQRIDDAARFPAHAMSDHWIGMIGDTNLRTAWANTESGPDSEAYRGVPWHLVGSSPDWATVSFRQPYAATDDPQPAMEQSDCAVFTPDSGLAVQQCIRAPQQQQRFPFPTDAAVASKGACGPQGCGERRRVVLESGACRLWEASASEKVGNQWHARATAAWDLNSHGMRPDGWSTGDAGGLPVLPLLLRAEEAELGEIRHALRVSFRDSVLDDAHVWPARHHDGGPTPGGIPFGARLRLRSDIAIPPEWTPQAKVVARAMQQYGLLVADIGDDFQVPGEPSVRWSNDTMAQLRSFTSRHFEFVDIRSVTQHPHFNADSLRASW